MLFGGSIALIAALSVQLIRTRRQLYDARKKADDLIKEPVSYPMPRLKQPEEIEEEIRRSKKRNT